VITRTMVHFRQAGQLRGFKGSFGGKASSESTRVVCQLEGFDTRSLKIENEIMEGEVMLGEGQT